MFDLKCDKCNCKMLGIKVGDGKSQPARATCFECEHTFREAEKIKAAMKLKRKTLPQNT